MASKLGWDGGLTASMGVKDLDRSIAWYRDVLGFTLLYKIDEMAWCEMSTGVDRVNVGLSQVEKVAPEGDPDGNKMMLFQDLQKK